MNNIAIETERVISDARPIDARPRSGYASHTRRSQPDLIVHPVSSGYELRQRLLDITLSLVGLCLLWPLILLTALLVKGSSPGPVLFRQKRLGRHSRAFACLKFRTMYQDAEARLQRDPKLLAEFQQTFKLKNDPRITPVGNFLRRTSLDELPQLVNVLRGEMSLIGPRPIVPKEVDKYGRYASKLLSVRPGLSGMWQASGRSETTYAERIALDMSYIDTRSTLLDIKLILQTLIAVFQKKGAC